jgi:hypothetical protein
MQMYVNRYDREIKQTDENPTIGLLLCEQNNQFVVKYTIGDESQQIFAKQYSIYLPSSKDLEEKLTHLVSQ